MAKMLKDALETIEKYKSITPHYGELLDILGEILILREEYRRKMKKVIFPIDEGLMGKKIYGGLPLIDFSAGTFDLTEPRKYFTALLEIAEKRAPGETKEVLQMIQDGSFNFEKMISDSFNSTQDEEISEDIDDDVIDLVDLFLEESLRPALEKVVEKYGKSIAKAGWTEGYCPICGKEPKIGEIREEEGRRFLFCTQCGFEWRFMRIKCPFCGNEEQQTLAYFSIEGEEKYRVDVCNECKRYIKTVDFRETKEEANLDVEDIATLHLDMLANEEGYD
ncbi:MAG: formate dehydrogenase accessory protein FdhE [Syntrophales bacterium]